MTAYVGVGSWAVTNGGSLNLAPPAGTDGDLVLANIGFKFPATKETTDAGKPTTNPEQWTLQTSAASGTTVTVSGGGSTRVNVFSAVAPAAAYLFTGSGNLMGPGSGIISRWSKAASDSTWSVAAVSAGIENDVLSQDLTLGTLDVKMGDWLQVEVVLKDDQLSHSSITVVVPGCTLGTMTLIPKYTTTTGNDMAQYVGYVEVLSGQSTGATRYTATTSSGAASDYSVAVTRIREVPATPPPPATPTGLTATAASVSQIDVTWSAVTGAETYDLEVDGVVVTGVSSPYAHTGLGANTTHTYRVRANSVNGSSAWSSSVSGTTQSYPAGRNLLLDSSFEAGTANTVVQSGATVTRSNERSRTGLWALKVVTPGVALDEGVQNIGGSGRAFPASTACTVSAWVWDDGATRLRLNIRFWNGTSAIFSSSATIPASGAAGWRRISWTGTSPADAVSASFKVTTAAVAPAQAVTFFVEDVQLEAGQLTDFENTSVMGPKFEEWNGTSFVTLTATYWNGTSEEPLTITEHS